MVEEDRTIGVVENFIASQHLQKPVQIVYIGLDIYEYQMVGLIIQNLLDLSIRTK